MCNLDNDSVTCRMRTAWRHYHNAFMQDFPTQLENLAITRSTLLEAAKEKAFIRPS